MAADWTFKSAKIAEGFDAHVREQLPWYDLATGAVAHIARHYIPQGGLVYDLGASTGNVGVAIGDTLKAREARFVAVEGSKEMAALYRGPGELIEADVLGFEFEQFDVAVCFLLLMFLPAGERKGFIRRLCQKIKPGGALIVFDKVEGPGGYLSTVLHRLTIAGKMAQGADAGEVIQKELSLIGVQRPLPGSFMSLSANPSPIEVFRFGEFVGWVVARPE
jgi:tRNA (cmo5U34)-methyltransferase